MKIETTFLRNVGLSWNNTTLKPERPRSSRDSAPRILNLGTRYSWVVGFTLRSLYPEGNVCGTHWIGVWVTTKVVINATEKIICYPYRESNPDSPILKSAAWLRY
jgi:hypothetical protein